VRGVVALAGVYDLERLMSFSESKLAASVRSSVPAGDADVRRFSPERNVRPGAPPMLLVVGGDETPPMIAEQRLMASAVRAVGGDVTTAEIPDLGHMGLVMHLSHPQSGVLSNLMTFIERHP
jgi:acetyl esterase/lipase